MLRYQLSSLDSMIYCRVFLVVAAGLTSMTGGLAAGAAVFVVGFGGVYGLGSLLARLRAPGFFERAA